MLFRKMLRELKVYKVQFISIMIMSFLALAIFAGLGSESKGYQIELDKYYRQTNFADIWLYSNGFSKTDEDNISNLNSISAAERRLHVNVTAKLDKDPQLDLYVLDDNNINKMYIKDGADYNPDSSDAIWLDFEFAKRRNLGTGDLISFSFMGCDYTFKIKGLVYSPEYIYKESNQMVPDHLMNGFAYISRSSLPEAFPEIYNEMILRLASDDIKIKDIEPEIYSLIQKNEQDGSYGISAFLTRDKITSHVVFNNEISERNAMTTVFPIAFLLIVLLTIVTTMTRLIKNQRMQIGILKALGFKRYKIMLHYVSYSFFLTSIGAISGCIIGPLVLPRMFYGAMQTIFTLPVWKPHFIFSSVIVSAVCIFLASLITYTSCKKILSEIPAEVLRPKAPKAAKLTTIGKSQFWKKRSFLVQWNIRDIFMSKIRSIMAIVGVSGCMGLLLFGFGAMDAFNSVINIKYDKISIYQNKYSLSEDSTQEQKKNIISKVAGEEIMEQLITVESNSVKEICGLQIHDNTSLYKYLDDNWNEFDIKKDGIMLSKKLAEDLDVKAGDYVQWCIFEKDEFKSIKVSAIFRDPTEQGCIISRQAYEEAGQKFISTAILSAKDKVSNLDGVDTIENIQDNRESIASMLETMYMLIALVCVVAGILEVVVLYNLGVLSFTEKERELATLKVIGFQSNRIRKLLLFQNIILTLVGLVPGYYFGLFIFKVVMAYMGSEFDIPVSINSLSIIICVGFTCILSILVNYMFSKKINQIDMVSSLKGVE